MAVPQVLAKDDPWKDTLDKVQKSVVVIKYYRPLNWDGRSPSVSEATGFIVKGGYILTNEHIVSTGAIRARCTFWNKDETDVYPVYRDAEHDYGFFRFDPEYLKKYTVQELELAPGLAKVGNEVCIAGNDSCTGFSISKGVISRLDATGSEGYFNTSYIQAATGANGGASGSPVVTSDGHVVGIMSCTHTNANIDEFVPTDRPLHVLNCLVEGREIKRGTIQVEWSQKSFEECHRLGLTENWRKEVEGKFPDQPHMLVARTILPEGPSDEKIQIGDVLLKVNGKLTALFLPLSEELDDSVGQTIEIVVLRYGREVTLQIEVQDFAKILPTRAFKFVGLYFHDLTYKMSMDYCVPFKGVYYSGGEKSIAAFHDCNIIESVDNEPTPDLETFMEIIKSKRDQQRVRFDFYLLGKRDYIRTEIVTMDRQWKPMQIWDRNDETGVWDMSSIDDFLPAEAQKKDQVVPVPAMARSVPQQLRPLAAGVVYIRAWGSETLGDQDSFRNTCFGLILDAEKGLILAPRAKVPHDRCHVVITFGGSTKIRGRIGCIHPLLNAVFIHYDPSLLRNSVQSIKFSEREVEQGEKLFFFTINEDWESRCKEVVVTSKFTYKSIHREYIDSISIDEDNPVYGFLCDKDGSVVVNWFLYSRGILSQQLVPLLNDMRRVGQAGLRMLETNLENIGLEEAGDLGVASDWLIRVGDSDPEHRQLFRVKKLNAGYKGPLERGDIILTIDGTLVTRALHLDAQYTKPVLEMRLNRKGTEVTEQVATLPTEHIHPERCLYTCGVSICDLPLAVRQECGHIFSNVWITHYARGTPAERFGFLSNEFLMSVNDRATPTFDDFCYEVNTVPDGKFFRVDCMNRERVPRVCLVRKDELFVPSKVTYKDANAPTGWATVPLADYVREQLGGKRPTPLEEAEAVTAAATHAEDLSDPSPSVSDESIEIVDAPTASETQQSAPAVEAQA